MNTFTCKRCPAPVPAPGLCNDCDASAERANAISYYRNRRQCDATKSQPLNDRRVETEERTTNWPLIAGWLVIIVGTLFFFDMIHCAYLWAMEVMKK